MHGALRRFHDLPSTDSSGKPLSRYAFVTLITQGGCSRRWSLRGSFGYSAGAFALVQSLRESRTAHRVVVAMTDAVENAAALAPLFEAAGAEPTYLAAVDHGSAAVFRRQVDELLRAQQAGEAGGAPQPSQQPRRELLIGVSRWKGMFTKLRLWAPGDALDKMVYLDSDHIVLRNMDHLFHLCNDGVCAVNDVSYENNLAHKAFVTLTFARQTFALPHCTQPTQRRSWDGDYFNAGLLVFAPNMDDYVGLLRAVVTNSLTTGDGSGGYDGGSFLDKDPKGVRHTWFLDPNPVGVLRSAED